MAPKFPFRSAVPHPSEGSPTDRASSLNVVSHAGPVLRLTGAIVERCGRASEIAIDYR